MSDTLFDAVKQLGRMVGGSRTGLVTGGTAGTIIDTRRFEVDDTWNQGTALIISTTDGLAPQSEWSVISDWALTTKTATLYDNLTATVGVGDRYSFLQPKYPLDLLLDKINQVLMSTRIVAIDSTTLDLVADQTEYSLPTGYDRSNLRQVWIQTNNDSNKNEWMQAMNWHVEYNGSTHLLILDPRLNTNLDNRYTGYAIKLIATPYHAQVYTPTSAIDDLIHLDRLVYGALELILVDELDRNTGDKFITHRLNWVIDKVETAKMNHPISLPEWHYRGSGW